MSQVKQNGSLSTPRIDDPVDAVAVHFGSGLLGLLAAPLLRNTEGVVTASASTLDDGLVRYTCIEHLPG